MDCLLKVRTILIDFGCSFRTSLLFSFSGADIGDVGIGVILLVLSLLLLCGCLVGLVKLLNSMLGARVKTIISDHVNKVRRCSVMHWIL